MNVETILVIDDEPGIRQTLASILEDENFRVFVCEDAIAGMELLQRETVNLVLLDVLLPKMGGLEALEKIKETWPDLEVVMISGHSNIDMAVKAVKNGAYDFMEKPLSLDKVLTVCRNAITLHKLRDENIKLKKKTFILQEEIIGTSASINKIRELIRQAASSDARILITGENGTGKEIVAKAIHNGSSRAGNNFVELNCAAIPDTLIESELFGHEKGAFTDAVSSRKGRFETAHRGTLLLDEIGDMSLSAQAKVLRAIQEQKIMRLGGEKTIDTDVRIIAATNQDLEKACEKGQFRQDLFFRLNVIPIHVPPLRERLSDIPILLYHFLKSMDMPDVKLETDALELLSSQNWPGNVRELRNLAERIAIMHIGASLNRDAMLELLNKGSVKKQEQFISDKFLGKNFNEAKESFEKHYLEFQFNKNNGIISKTAEAIGIYPSNLHAKLKKYGIAGQSAKEKQ